MSEINFSLAIGYISISVLARWFSKQTEKMLIASLVPNRGLYTFEILLNFAFR